MADHRLEHLLRQRILVLDGAMGTAIQNRNLGPEDFGGEELEGCNENLVLTRPDVIADIHEAYLKAGADIIETDTFGSTPLVLDEYDLGHQAHELNVTAAKLARDLADTYSTKERPRFVAGSIGPTTKAISVTGGITFSELVNQFYQQAKGLHEGGVDYFLLETCQDTRNVKAGLLGIDRLMSEVKRQIPVAISGTIEPMGTMLGGQTVDALFASVHHVQLLYMGLNCATGPEFMTDHIRTLAEISGFPVACVPNAGLPDVDGNYLETPRMMSEVLARFGNHGWLNLIGGCCGTTPQHIEAFAKLAEELTPRQPTERRASIISGVDFLEITEEMRPVIVGERTNVIGSRKFKRLICEGKFEEASEVGRAQVKNGAHIVDVCVANPDRDEMADMEHFLEEAIKKIRVPLMIDSTDAKVIEQALTYSQGKAIINSINLEDGLERFDQVVPIARKFGAAFVVGCIDDDPQHGMAVSRERKLEVAERSHRILTEDYGVPAEDIYFDPLVFPCATGDENYLGSAEETIEGIRLIKERLPACKTILGISNVSFGLPPAGREILNSVFLYLCVQAGLDLAIVNSEKLERYASIPDDERKLAEDLLFNRGDDPVAEFAERYRGKKPKSKLDKKNVPLDERLASYILEGTKEGLVEDLEEKRQTTEPLEIINGPLMDGMDEVGRLFNDNQLIVAEVLQSAEAMKAAVGHLEQFMEKSESGGRGKVLLATVKGDVHDIGKNLVDIILSNNGFEVINLGIKIPPEQLIAAIREHQPDIVGLSGLLVKSAQMMLVTAEDFSNEGIDLPMLVGGAALSEKFVLTRIDPLYKGTAIYAQDAMSGLELAKQIVDPERFAQLQERQQARVAELEGKAPVRSTKSVEDVGTERSAALPLIESPPEPPDYERHLLRNTPIDQIWSYINPRMLFGRHLGMKNSTIRLLEQAANDRAARAQLEKEDPGSLKTWDAVLEVKETYRNTPYMKPSAVYQFFRAAGEGNHLHVFASPDDAEPAVVFDFPRQPRDPKMCLADLVNPLGGTPDNMAMFVTTVGDGVRELADELNAKGQYLRSHILMSLAIESAEGYAEFLHAQLRRMWGIPDPPDTKPMDIFRAHYTGKRYSFGYPACPQLGDQEHLWKLLRPQEIGCELTEECMMDPEASTSALVFHHPQAQYFTTGQGIMPD